MFAEGGTFYTDGGGRGACIISVNRQKSQKVLLSSRFWLCFSEFVLYSK